MYNEPRTFFLLRGTARILSARTLYTQQNIERGENEVRPVTVKGRVVVAAFKGSVEFFFFLFCHGLLPTIQENARTGLGLALTALRC